MLLNSEVVKSFYDSMTYTHAASTRYGYASLTRTYLRTLGPDATHTSLTEEGVRSYLANLEARGLRPATLVHHLYALRAFCAWLVTRNVLAANPTTAIKPPKLDDPIREVPSDDQVRRLLAACDEIASDYRERLARAVLVTLCYAGVRRNELLDLKWPDIDLSAHTLKVRHGKGNKPRTVIIGTAIVEAIRAYLAVRPVCTDPSPCKICQQEQRLFLLRRHIALGDEGLRTLLRDLQKLSGQKGSLALLPHGLRHHFATRLDAEGASLPQIQKILGHADVKTTMKYVHPGDPRLRELAELVELGPPPPEPPNAEPDSARRSNAEPDRRSLRLWQAQDPQHDPQKERPAG